jgi:Trk-type K+ transport system membrane component
MRQLLLIVGLLCGFLLLGAVTFHVTEGWDWLQCFYEAVIIMTTVGLSATAQAELHSSTKLFIIGFLIFGIGIFTYCVSQLTSRRRDDRPRCGERVIRTCRRRLTIPQPQRRVGPLQTPRVSPCQVE